MSSTDESLSAGGGESSPADSIHTEDGAAKTINEKRRGEELMIQLKRIKSESVVQQIIDSLVEAMIRKELKPGDQIPTEMELAERLGVGRNAGYIALWCGIANGAESVVIPETYDYNEVKIMKTIAKHRENGKKNNIIINAEGVGDTSKMAKRIQAISGIHVRATILSYIQRGGTPTCRDRVYASVMGAKAVDLLCEGKTNRIVAYKNGNFVDYDVDEALSMKGGMTEGLKYMYEILEDLSV